MSAIKTADEIELVYLWQDSATGRMFFTTHLVPNQLQSIPVSSPTVSESDTLPFEVLKEEIKVFQEVPLPEIIL